MYLRHLQHCLRLMDEQGGMHFIRHRIFYLDFDAAGHVQLALCLYTAAGQDAGATGIVHSIDATLIHTSVTPLKGLLSNRECEILLLISKGKASKQIADALEISISTVNNHRQNILRKLHCQNTAEAYGRPGGSLPRWRRLQGALLRLQGEASARCPPCRMVAAQSGKIGQQRIFASGRSGKCSLSKGSL